jgi:hypothetical protein
MNSIFETLADIPTWLLMFIGIVLVSLVWFLSSVALRSQLKRGLSLSDAKDEMEIRKAFFTIVGMVSIVVTIAFTASEVSVAVRAENREQLYAALGQLAESDAQNPEVSAAALLQLGKLGATSPDDLPALVRVVNAYLTANAQFPVAEHDGGDVTRPDIEVAMLVLSDLVTEQPDLGSLVRLKSLDLRFLRAADLFLPQARLIDVNLTGATLRGADFSRGELVNVNIENGNFSEVNVTGATLRGLSIDGTPHLETNFCESSIENRRIAVDGQASWTTEDCEND